MICRHTRRSSAPIWTPFAALNVLLILRGCIAFATSPGQIALDGSGRNGRFTEAILKHIKAPNITIEDMFKRVRNTLSSSTNGKQLSWEHTSLMGDFHFNYPYVTEEFNTTYDDAALADAMYMPEAESPLYNIIRDLRSHNWYNQNPALVRIGAVSLERCNVNDLFVLGRNIYQAACGSAHEAAEYLQSLDARLNRYDETVSFHILNGMVFEIYFNSHGVFRAQLKSECMDNVFSVLELPKFSESVAFIRKRLAPYEKYLFYLPGQKSSITLNIVTVRKEERVPAVAAIYYDGDNVLYSSNGESYYEVEKEQYQFEMDADQIEIVLGKEIGTPRRRLILVYSPEKGKRMLFPYSRLIQRISQ